MLKQEYKDYYTGQVPENYEDYSIDRIDSNLGYIEGNIVITTNRVNAMKNDMSIEEFKKLKNKISAVITTNYDLFLEKYIFPDDYTVFTRQHELFSKDSYNIAEIYKIHGSANDANTIMITEKDYDEFNESRKYGKLPSYNTSIKS